MNISEGRVMRNLVCRLFVLSWTIVGIPGMAADKSVIDMSSEELDSYLHPKDRKTPEAAFTPSAAAPEHADADNATDSQILSLVSQLRALHQEKVMTSPPNSAVGYARDRKFMHALRAEGDILLALSVKAAGITQTRADESVGVLLQVIHTADRIFKESDPASFSFYGRADRRAVDSMHDLAGSIKTQAINTMHYIGPRAISGLKQFLRDHELHSEAEDFLRELGDAGSAAISQDLAGKVAVGRGVADAIGDRIAQYRAGNFAAAHEYYGHRMWAAFRKKGIDKRKLLEDDQAVWSKGIRERKPSIISLAAPNDKTAYARVQRVTYNPDSVTGMILLNTCQWWELEGSNWKLQKESQMMSEDDPCPNQAAPPTPEAEIDGEGAEGGGEKREAGGNLDLDRSKSEPGGEGREEEAIRLVAAHVCAGRQNKHMRGKTVGTLLEHVKTPDALAQAGASLGESILKARYEGKSIFHVDFVAGIGGRTIGGESMEHTAMAFHADLASGSVTPAGDSGAGVYDDTVYECF